MAIEYLKHVYRNLLDVPLYMIILDATTWYWCQILRECHSDSPSAK